ncbi:TRAP transporter small permease [Marasmitruncus massiliensis]|uniref:TRAP transporter small permease n=1 Tax=Marasmitruncus massiliensis TaxID=1944642 RepID=UPI001A9A4882|nr:TRAP transporter small permease [Marasmitruncus massiliensis]
MKNTFRTGIEKINSFFNKLSSLESFICCYLLIILVLITFAQVCMRFLFNSPFSWAEEVTLMFLVWFGYLCMALDIHTDSHAALYFLYNKMPAPIRKAADLIRHGLLTWLFVEMVKYGGQITKLNMAKRQPATQFSQGWLFAPLVVGGILMVVYSILNFIIVLEKPLSEYQKESQKEKTIDDLNIERGGTV